MFFPPSRFTEHLIRGKKPDDIGFKQWVFYPGMLFGAIDKWWGDRGRRKRPHEGLDIRFYQDRSGAVRHLDDTVGIPAMYDGVVVRIIKDFIGRSVFMEHDPLRRRNRGFFTIYGHVAPDPGLKPGSRVKQGETIAALSGGNRPGSLVPPHLHITLGTAPQSIPYNRLDWETLETSDLVTLFDPLAVIGRHQHPVSGGK